MVENIRNAGDSPRYKLMSPQPNLVVCPVKLELTDGAISDASSLPLALGAEMLDTTTLRLSWPESLGRDPRTFFFYLVGEGETGIVQGVDLSTVKDGYADFDLGVVFSGRFEGYIGGASGAQNTGALNVPSRSNKAATERALFPVRCLCPQMHLSSLLFTVGSTGEHGLRNGPMEYTVERWATGNYLVDVTFAPPTSSAPIPETPVQIGTTDEGNTVSVRHSTVFGRLYTFVRAFGGTLVDLIDGEQVRMLIFGRLGDGVAFHKPGASLASVAARPKNNAGTYPLFSLVRCPIFIPFRAEMDGVGDLKPSPDSFVPSGTYLKQVATGNDEYALHHGALPVAAGDPAKVNPWLTGEFLLSSGDPIRLDGSDVGAGQDWSKWVSPAITYVDGVLITGYALLSGSRER